MGYLYRGVHAGHPALYLAKRGIVRPGKQGSTMTPEEHNDLGLSELSPFTSWTRSRRVATWFARSRGPGGVLLRVPEGSPSEEDEWHWEYSPDEYGEEELLLYGVRLGVEVLEV